MNKEIQRDACRTLDKYYKELRRKATPAELLFKKALEKRKIKFKFQKYFFSEDFRCIVDFYINRFNARLVVEIDGGYHTTLEQQRKDNYRSNWLITQRGCKVIRFTNDQVLNDVNSCIDELIETKLKRRKTPLPDWYNSISATVYDNSTPFNQNHT